jgi:hypothetical protein
LVDSGTIPVRHALVDDVTVRIAKKQLVAATQAGRAFSEFEALGKVEILSRFIGFASG